MPHGEIIHHRPPRFARGRRSIRLPGYDYTASGFYFVTIVTHERARLFGEIVHGEMRLNETGKIVESHWRVIPTDHRNVSIDEFVVMPNHIHGIIIIGDESIECETVGAGSPHPDETQIIQPRPAEIHNARRSLGQIFAKFKYQYTKCINQMNGTPGVKIFQRNYYEHIIRNETDLSRIREYIRTNPQRWEWGRGRGSVG